MLKVVNNENQAGCRECSKCWVGSGSGSSSQRCGAEMTKQNAMFRFLRKRHRRHVALSLKIQIQYEDSHHGPGSGNADPCL